MRILEVITALSSGGAERFIVDLCNQMAEDGHDIILMTMKDPAIGNNGFYLHDISDKVKFISLNLTKFGPFTFYTLYKAIKNVNCDIVHMHLDPHFFGIVSFLLDRDKKYFITSHSQAESEKLNFLRFWVKKIGFRLHLYEQIAISHQNAESIAKVYGSNAVGIIYNGRASMAVTDEFSNVEKEINQYRYTLNTLVFTTIARCNPAKNIPKLVRCFNEVKKRGYDITLLVIGDGYEGPTGLGIQQKALDHIHFLGAKHNIVDYLEASDFFTLSSDYEGMPITLIEAMACGCIPIGTPVSGFNDVIIDGKNGFIAKDFSDEAYIHAIELAIQNKASISRIDLQQSYKDNFSIHTCSSHYVELFQK